jgi:hypothetical protein
MALHFLGAKPWACYRDFDCNFVHRGVAQFADEKFMKVYHEYCIITMYA